MSDALLQLRGIDKHFGPVQALYGVDLDLPAGQVTGLCGDNGAGKSVLTRCIAGVHQPDHGQIFFEGRPVHIRSARDAAALGIETVYQDLALADNLDIVQNMFLGRERLRRGLLDEDSMERAAAETLSGLRVTTVRSIRQPVASLSGGQRQSVAVAKAVMWNSRVALLDEPTAALGRGPDPDGPGPDPAPPRPRSGGDGDLPQPQRRLQGGRPDRGAPPRADGRRGTGRRLRPAEHGGVHDHRWGRGRPAKAGAAATRGGGLMAKVDDPTTALAGRPRRPPT